MSDANELWYDTEIAPQLRALAEACGARGISFLACVEYAPGEIGATRYLKDAGLEMVMLAHCAKCGTNIDGYIIGLLRYARENDIDIRSSDVMQKMGGVDSRG